MCKEVVERTIANVFINATANRTAKVQFQVNFLPDEVIVRQLTYQTTEAASLRTYQIATNMVDDQIIGVFPAATCSTKPETRFRLNKNVNGQYAFSLQGYPASGTGSGLDDVNAIGVVGMILEFVKYKK